MACCMAAAQESRALPVRLELDGYYTNWGTVYYPRIKWQARTHGVTVRGFGFIYRDRNPGQWFANHPVTVTADRLWQLSLRMELGGVGKDVRVGKTTHQYFFQLGPQVNFVKPVPGKPQYLVASFLPHLGGIRPHNFLTAFATPETHAIPRMAIYLESYQRMFPERGIKRSYGEAWLWLRPKAAKHIQFAPIVRLNGGKLMFGGGVRLIL